MAVETATAAPAAERAPLSVRPLRIREYEFWPPVLPAPMCGISDRAWRILSRENGCPLVFTQMVSSEAMIRGRDRCWDLLDMDRGEHPVCTQLFGADPAILAECARRLQDAGSTIVDLNMGCPVNKIVKSKGGSALMREPDLVRMIFRAMRAALRIPFTVKFRAGFEKYGEEAITIARIAEEEGLDAVCIHGRTREQQFRGAADWSVLRVVKEVVSIPVIGNGDVKTPDDAERMIRETNVDGVMVGRAAMGNPWLFSAICARLAGRPELPQPGVEERLDTVARHARIMFERKGEHGLVEFRKHAVQYLRGFRSAKQLKAKLLDLRDPEAYFREIEHTKLHIAEMELAAAEEAIAEAPEVPQTCEPQG